MAVFYKRILSVLIIGGLYYIWILFTDIKIPCIFKEITGLKCPGCGITSMLLNVLQFDFEAAFRANSFLFLSSPMIIVQLVYIWFMQARKSKLPDWNETLCKAYLVCLLVFGIFRNFNDL